MAAAPLTDPVELARALLRCPSITPRDAGALAVVEQALAALGAKCHRLPFGEPPDGPVENLYARVGGAGRNFCFAGHTDVVPPGDEGAWSAGPFAAEVRAGKLYGRGAVDMKGALACFLAALARFLAPRPSFAESVSVLVTGDEEGVARHGTRRVLEWLQARGEVIDACLVGEPTSASTLGDELKVGRRGSLNARLVVRGIQGHVAYPHKAENPIHAVLGLLQALVREPLDQGSAAFSPSALQITSIDTGNPATNVIPARVEVRFNVRFNDRHTGETLERALRRRFDEAGLSYALDVQLSGEAFVTPPGPLTDLVGAAVLDVVGLSPAHSTSGGTSDARFLRTHAPVIELGLVNATAHKVDEYVTLDDLEQLTRIYQRVLERYFGV